MGSLKGLFPSVVFLIMGACASVPSEKPTTENIIIACQFYGVTLMSLSSNKIPVDTIYSIEKSLSIVSPLCSNPSQSMTPKDLMTILTETGNLEAIIKSNNISTGGTDAK